MPEPPKSLRIVVGYDGSDAAQRGLARIRRLAAGRLNVLVVAVEPDVRSPGLGVGDPAGVLIEAARQSDAELVIVGRRGADFVARTLLGSMSQRVVQNAPCDVLVVA